MSFISRLKFGYRRFYLRHFLIRKSLYRELSTGQSPEAMMIACSDSRVDPAMLTRAAPGDIFVVRNIANIVPNYEFARASSCSTSAALEFSVNVLKVKDIIVVGHSQCGGIDALINGAGELKFVERWVGTAQEVRQMIDDEYAEVSPLERQTAAERASLKLSLKNLMTFPWVAEKVNAGELELHAWYFDLQSGHLYRLDTELQKFECML